MGFFDNDNICGLDINCDGRRDEIDDILFFEEMNKDHDEEEDEEHYEYEDEDEEIEVYELKSYGIDKDEFDLMDDDEKREALEEAGLDPDDYDF